MLLELIEFFFDSVVMSINEIKLPGTEIGMVTFIFAVFTIIVGIGIIKSLFGINIGGLNSSLRRIGGAKQKNTNKTNNYQSHDVDYNNGKR